MTLTLKILKMEQQLSPGAIQRPLCHPWEKPEGEKSALNRGLAWFEAWPRSSGTIKEDVMAKNEFSAIGGAKSFHINDHQGFVLGADVPGTTETAPGSCKVYKKKITLGTVQIGII